MKNKGFTLIEILVTIAIIGIIILIAVPSIMAVSKSIKKRELETKKEALISSAEEYAKNNLSEFGDATILKVPVRTLIYYGYVPKEKDCSEPIGCVINPIDNTSMNDEIITIKRNLSITQATWGSIDAGLEATFYWNGADNQNGAGFITKGCNSDNSCTITTPNITRLSDPNYTIVGWGSNPNSKTSVFSGNETITLTQNSKYYAVTKKEVTLSFHSNDGTFSDNTQGTKTASCMLYNTKTSCVLTENIGVVKTGNTFVEWNTQLDGSGNGYSNGQEISLQESTDLYPKWRKNILYLKYNGNGHTAFSSNNTAYSVNNSGYLLKNNVVYTKSTEYGEYFSTSAGLANYNNKNAIKFTKTGYHGASEAEWKIGTTTFDQYDTSVTSNQLAAAGGCDFDNGDCIVTAYVNWTKNILYLKYNGNGGTWNSNNTAYSVDSKGNVKKDGSVYIQQSEYNSVFDSKSGLANYNNQSVISFTKPSGYNNPSSGAEWKIGSTTFSQSDTSITANQLASAAGCKLSKGNCTVKVKVNWVKSSGDSGSGSSGSGSSESGNSECSCDGFKTEQANIGLWYVDGECGNGWYIDGGVYCYNASNNTELWVCCK